MKPTRKSGKEGRAKGAGKKTMAGARPAMPSTTRRGKTADSLKESEEKYKLLIEATNTGYVIVDAQGRVLDANEEYVRITGHGSLAELAGRAVTEWTAPCDLERNAAEVRKCMESGSVRNLVIDYVGPQGRVTPVEINATVLRGPGLPRIFTVCRDISERKRAEDALRESEAKARSIIASIPLGMHLYRLEDGGRLVFMGANPAADTILGVDNSSFIGKTIEEAFPPLQATEIPRRYREAAASGTAWRTEQVIYHDGAIQGAFEVHAFQTAPMTMVAAFSDITRRKQMEEALHASESRYKAIVDSQAEFIVRYQPGGIITFVNDTLCRYANMTREDLLGRSYFPFMHPGDRGEFVRKIEALDRKNPSMVAEARVVLPDGRESWHQWTHHAIFDERGDLAEYQCTGRDVTELKAAEARIKESERKYRDLFESSNDGIFILDLEGSFIDANPAAYARLGYTREELLSMNIGALDTPEYADKVPGRLKQLREQGAAVFESANRRKDGTVMQIEVNARLLEYEGKPVIVSVNRDITERKRAEEALRKSEKMLQTIIDAEPDCIKIIDEESRLVMMNRAGLNMVQADSFEQVKGQVVCPLIAPEYQQAFMDLTRQVFQGGSGRLEFRMTGMKGRQLWLETHAVPLRNEKDAIIAALGVTRDITEHKRAEEELRENQARLDLALQSAHMGVWRWEIRENKRYFDDLTCQLLGIDAAAFTGTGEEFLTTVHPEDRPKIKAALARTIEQDVLYEPEYRVVWPEGSVHYISARGRLVRDDRGQPARINGIVWDITEQRLLEEERLKAQKLESIGMLAGGIAHDFNNLLQGVFGYISMARLTFDKREKALAMLEQAEKALHQSVNLTSQLLTFSKGGKPMRTVIDLRPVIENAVKFALSGSPVDHEMAMADDLRPVEADEGQIAQVIQNIVLNAEQAMPLGGRIEISARNVPASSPAGVPADPTGDLVEITIRDHGMGIPPEHLPKIFDPYFTTKEKGSGLGLATSYSIIKNHDGALTVSSRLGRGSTFTIHLPSSALAPDPPARLSAPDRAGSGRVLVMDDEEVVRKVAGELLRTLGYDVEVAEHGESALMKYREARAEGRPFDAVILDLTVRGGMGGAETVRQLLEIDPGVKTVVSSGYSDDEVVSSHRQHGFRSFLKKPYDIEALRSALDELMR